MNNKLLWKLFILLIILTGIVTLTLIAINGVADHIHILIGLKPDMALSDLVRVIKSNSSKIINEKKFVRVKFNWQEGFGAFSYSHSQLSTVIKYIENQEKHQNKTTFNNEYLELLKKYAVEYDSKYLFK